MSCRNLIVKPLKFLCTGILKHRPIHSHVNYASYSYSVFCRQKLKYNFNTSTKVFPSVNFHTSGVLCESSEEDLTQPIVKLTFVMPDQEEVEVEGRVGMTVMEIAVKNKIPMEAACEGQLACTTCHVYVEKDTKKYFEDASTEEEDLLDAAPFCRPNSRLSCQLKITDVLEGARFHLPSATTNFSVDGKVQKHS